MNGKERQQAGLATKLRAMLAPDEQLRVVYLGARGRDYSLLVIGIVVVPGILYGLTFDSILASAIAGAASGAIGALLAVALLPKAVVTLTDRRLLVAKASAFPLGVGDVLLDRPAADISVAIGSHTKNSVSLTFADGVTSQTVVAPRPYVDEAAAVVAALDALRR